MRITKYSLLILGFVFSMALFMDAEAGYQDPQGKILFVNMYNCIECHDVQPANIKATTESENEKGPDLGGYSSDNEFSKLAAYLRQESDLDGKSHKKAFKGSDEELQTIVDWLGSLDDKKDKTGILNDPEARGDVVRNKLTDLGFQVDRVVEGEREEFFDVDITGFNGDNTSAEYRGALEPESMNTETKYGHIEVRLTVYDGILVLLLNKSDLLKFGIKLLLYRSLFGMWEILKK